MAATLYGTLSAVDTTHHSEFFGAIGLSGVLEANDSIHYFPVEGYIVDDSTRLPQDSTFFQGAILGQGDMTFNTVDWTYAHGRLNVDGTWVDGTFRHQWYDPHWIFFSTWYQNYDDTSEWSLVGYKFREPVRENVGKYYASMVVPETVGHYENRWTYQRDSSSYAKEVVQPFVSMSRGIDYMPDYPDTTTLDST